MAALVLTSTGLWREGRWIVLSVVALAYVAFGFLSANPGGAVLAAVFLASLGGSIGGVAFSALCGIVLFRLPLDPMRAVQIMMTCSIANQAIMTWFVRRDIDWRGLSPFLLGGVLGLPLGLWILLHADHGLFMRALGAFLLAYGGYMLARKPVTLRTQHPCLDLVAGLMGGILGAAAAFPSGPIAIWCSLKGWNKARQRAIFQPFILIMQVASLFAIFLFTPASVMRDKGFTPNDLLCILVSLLGAFIGLALYQRISTRQFAIALNLLLMAAGISFLF